MLKIFEKIFSFMFSKFFYKVISSVWISLTFFIINILVVNKVIINIEERKYLWIFGILNLYKQSVVTIPLIESFNCINEITIKSNIINNIVKFIKCINFYILFVEFCIDIFELDNDDCFLIHYNRKKIIGIIFFDNKLINLPESLMVMFILINILYYLNNWILKNKYIHKILSFILIKN
jgi:hypothetical protein